MKRKFVLLILGVIIFGISSAQSNQPRFDSFPEYLLSHVKLDEAKICDHGLYLVRFKVDPSGNVTDITFSRNIDPVIKNALRKAIDSTSGRWKPVLEGQKQVMSKYLVLPFMINIETGCNQEIIDDYFKPSNPGPYKNHIDSMALFIANSRKKTLDNYLFVKGYRATNDLFYFEDGSKWPFDCIMLQKMDFSYDYY